MKYPTIQGARLAATALTTGLLLVGCISGAAIEEPEPQAAVVDAEITGSDAVEAPAAEPAAEVMASDADASAGTVAAMPAEPEVSAPAYKREDVVWIQQRLQELGYYSRSVDGSVGQATRNAVRAYQRDQDIAADGRPTSELREFMWRNGG